MQLQWIATRLVSNILKRAVTNPHGGRALLQHYLPLRVTIFKEHIHVLVVILARNEMSHEKPSVKGVSNLYIFLELLETVIFVLYCYLTWQHLVMAGWGP